MVFELQNAKRRGRGGDMISSKATIQTFGASPIRVREHTEQKNRLHERERAEKDILCIRCEGKKNTCHSFVGEFLYLYWQMFGMVRSYGKIMKNSVIREFSCL